MADARVLVLGLTFKENCPDLRNTRVIDVVRGLQDYGVAVDVHDPNVAVADAQAEFGLDLVQDPKPGTYDGIILAVAHDEFRAMSEKMIRDLGRPGALLYDLKYVLPPDQSDLRL